MFPSFSLILNFYCCRSFYLRWARKVSVWYWISTVVDLWISMLLIRFSLILNFYCCRLPLLGCRGIVSVWYWISTVVDQGICTPYWEVSVWYWISTVVDLSPLSEKLYVSVWYWISTVVDYKFSNNRVTFLILNFYCCRFIIHTIQSSFQSDIEFLLL